MIYHFPDYKIAAAISLRVNYNEILLDLDYGDDSKIDVYFNSIMNEARENIEIQVTAEGALFSKE